MRGIEHTGYEIDAAIELLELLKVHLQDLHTLAYNRHEAKAWGDKVKGGSHDYALDTHGDQRARDLLTDLSDQTKDMIRKGTDVAKQAKAFLTNADVQRVHRRDGSADATLDEVIAALANARRQRMWQDPAHPPLVSPPVMARGHDWHQDFENLQAAVRKVVPRFQAEHAACVTETAGEYGRARRVSRRFDLSVLTPAEREVWRRSLNGSVVP